MLLTPSSLLRSRGSSSSPQAVGSGATATWLCSLLRAAISFPSTITSALRPPPAPDMFEVDLSEPATSYGWPRVHERRTSGARSRWRFRARSRDCVRRRRRLGRLRRKQVLDLRSRRPRQGFRSPGISFWRSRPASSRSRRSRRRSPPPAGGPAAHFAGGRRTTGDGAERIDTAGLAGRCVRSRTTEPQASTPAGCGQRSCARFALAVGFSAAEDLAAYRPRVTVERGGGIAACATRRPVIRSATRRLNILSQFEVSALGPASWRVPASDGRGARACIRGQHAALQRPCVRAERGLRACERASSAQSRAADISLDRAASRPIAPGDPWPFADGAQPDERREPSAAGLCRHEPHGGSR